MFLRVDENKTELFEILAQRISELPNTDKQIITTFRNEVLCNQNRQQANLSPCSHEESDTRIILHLADAAKSEYDRIMLRTVDTDVVVLAITYSYTGSVLGTGKHFRYLGAHCIAKTLGPDKSSVLPLFHAFTGCDTVSAFHGKGKKSAWDTWTAYGELTCAFAVMMDPVHAVHFDVFMPVIQRFVAVIHDRTSSSETLDAARLHILHRRGTNRGYSSDRGCIVTAYKESYISRRIDMVKRFSTKTRLSKPWWLWVDHKEWPTVGTSVDDTSRSSRFLPRTCTLHV